MLEESVGDHRHERMAVTTLPEWSLEVIETQFFFQLLMRLFTNPARLDGGRQRLRTYIFPPNFGPPRNRTPAHSQITA